MLRLFTGAQLELAPGEQRTFGRRDCGKPVESVSRCQFSLEAGAEGVRVTALGAANPTKVLLASQPGTALLSAGESRLLAPGDRVLLLAPDPSMWVEVAAAHGGGGGAEGAGPAAAGEPPAKRPRTEQQQQQQQPAGRGGGQAQDSAAAAAAAAAAAGAPPAVAAPLPVLLLLVGLQGAGKSTFCQNLIARTQQPAGGAAEGAGGGGTSQQAPAAVGGGGGPSWCRINQDSIDQGRRGTREQCLEAARAALQRRECVLVDRTNVSPDQRRGFLRLAAEAGAPAHCLFLKLPTKLCMGRAAGRTDHEGALLGKAAYPAVAGMKRALDEAGDPQPREGFASILICESDGEVAAALEAWAGYGRSHGDPVAAYARLKPPPPKAPPKNTLLNYFKKEGGSAGGGAAAGGGGTAGQQRREQQQGTRPPPQPQQQQPPPPQPPPQQQRQRHAFPAGTAWAGALVRIAADPESCRAQQPGLWFDDRCALLADLFPKARQHWLVLAREPRLGGPLDLAAADVPLLQHMLDVARRKAGELRAADPSLAFRFGFHSAPSLRQLHLHIVSQDFDSPGLKHKKHWNSFTHPQFWLDGEAALRALRQRGQLAYSLPAAEAALKADLRCHRCHAAQPNMPQLKAHIARCAAPPPGERPDGGSP